MANVNFIGRGFILYFGIMYMLIAPKGDRLKPLVFLLTVYAAFII
jgi:hypothetical protein